MTTVFLFLFSCKQKTDHTKEISHLDSTSFTLLLAEKNLLSVDTNNIRKTYDTISDRLSSLTERLSKDTINKKTAIILSAAYEETENIENLLRDKKNLTISITESKLRINNLKHDLNKNLIEENKSNEYIVNEINSSKRVSNSVNRMIEQAHISLHKLDSLKTELISLEDSLKD